MSIEASKDFQFPGTKNANFVLNFNFLVLYCSDAYLMIFVCFFFLGYFNNSHKSNVFTRCRSLNENIPKAEYAGFYDETTGHAS